MTNLNWELWLKEGDQYLGAATPKGKSSKFGSEIRYNLLSMSMEKYIMAMLDFHQTLPDNHTYTDLFDALDKVMEIDPELKDRILKYENIQSICSIEKYHTEAPSETELDDLHGAIVELNDLAHKTCSPTFV